MANWLAQHMERTNLAGLPVCARDRNSVHVRRPDGVIEAQIATRPIHFRNERGIWQPIDTRLERSTRGSGEYRAEGVPVSLRADGLVEIVGTSWRQRTQRLVIFDMTKQQVARTLAAFGSGTTVDDRLLRGPDSFLHTLQVLPDGLREDVTISDAIGGTKASEWLMLETEIVGRSWRDGWIDRLPSLGNFRFPPPTLQDATGRVVRASMFTIRRDGVQWLYTGVPLALLSGLKFPVTLDPNFTSSSVVTYVGESDVDYATAHSTYSYDLGGLTAGQLYQSGKTTLWTCYRPKLEFDVTSAVGQDVVGLVLRLKSSGSGTLNDTIEVTSLASYSDYEGAVSATRQNDFMVNGTSFEYDVQYDSLGLDRDYLSSASVYYGLLGTGDRNAVEPLDESGMIGFADIYTSPPLLIVLYTVPVPVAGGLLVNRGMAGGING